MASGPNDGPAGGLTRRGALRALGSTALVLGGAGVGRVVAETVEVATVKRGEVPLVTQSVPADWAARERATREVLAGLRSRFADVAGVVDVALGPGGPRVGGQPTSAIEVEVDPETGTGTTVPEEVDGVPSRVRESSPTDSLVCEDEAIELSGNVPLRSATGRRVTATCEVAWEGDHYLLTCAHLFNDDRVTCGDMAGAVVFDDEGTFVGRVAGYDAAQDWLVVDGSGAPVRVDASIAGADGTLAGRITRMGLHDLMNREEPVYKLGAQTGRNAGTIQRLGVSHGGCSIGDGVSGSEYADVDVFAQPGDSGGPVYYPFERDGQRYLGLVGLTSALVDHTRISTAYSIHDEHGIRFDVAGRASP